uniref:Uncharacterized protein n=1 Tax=Paramoeba aestuarina TaxID=180227 RepID=A0A7S4P728_9EUKA|mmetsp:Transcript_37326/g.58792  ORF Transcript_37326/g.58792 Transcript_37326/m.58792 type:complete len:336 (+) Transcript_37326:3-1010(+)
MPNDKGNVKIHFDGHTNRYDYWCPINHPNLGPPGTCRDNDIDLHPPSNLDGAGWEGPGPFHWPGYLAQKRRKAVSPGFFPSSHKFRRRFPGVGNWDDVKLGCHLSEFGPLFGDEIDNEDENLQLPKEEDHYSVLYHLPLVEKKAPSSFICDGKGGRDGCVKKEKHQTYWTDDDYFNLCVDCMQYYRIQKGMMLEAIDIKTTGYLCVASIKDFDHEGNVRIHFDGWTERYDYWCPRNHVNLAPPGEGTKKDIYLHPPSSRDGAEWNGPGEFNWEEYLKQKGRIPVSPGFFSCEHAFWDKLPTTQWGKVKEDCMSLEEYKMHCQENAMRGLSIKGAY